MINVETIKFVKMLDELAEKSVMGIAPFSAIPSQVYEKVVCYDDEHPNDDGTYQIVQQALMEDDHHDVVSCIEDTPEYTVHVVCSRKDGDYIEVRLLDSDTYILVEDGKWYVA